MREPQTALTLSTLGLCMQPNQIPKN